MFLISRKTLLFLSSDNLHAQVWKDGALAQASCFAHSAEGMQQFSAFLETHHDPAYILVDLIEEDFRHEIVPHLSGANHHALIQRKFEQYYRNTQFRLARRQRRQSEGRRDDEMLFSALTNPARVTTWLDLLLQHKTPVAGIYSLPHACIPLVKDIDYEQLLLVSWEKDAGLRQSYYFNQRLRFSRLTPMPPSSTFADAVAIESARTYQYLQSLSLTPHGELLKVHIISHANDRPQLEERLSSNKHMVYSYLDLQQLGNRTKSQDVFPDSDATPLFLHLLATKPPRGNYAGPLHTHYFRLWQTRRGLFALAAATSLTCLLWSTLSLLEGSGVSAEIDGYKTEASRTLQDAQRITQEFPGATPGPAGGTASASDMKTAVTLFRNLRHYSVPPQQILKGLTDTLDSYPRIRTSKVGWQMSAAGNVPEQVISFNGELADFGSDYRGALNYLERFQLVLTRAGYSVTPLRLPLDFSSQGSISGDNAAKPSEFSLKIVWRPQQ